MRRTYAFNGIAWLVILVACALTAGTAFGQWSTNNATSPPTVYPTDSTANIGIGTNVADSKITIAGAETFRYNPNSTARLVDFDLNHVVNAVQARNGAAFRIDLRWDLGVPAFYWFTRNAGEALPGALQTMKMYLDSSGALVINYAGLTGNTGDKLQVNGSARIGGNIVSTGTITGANVQAMYQDVAEWVPAEAPLSPATVVVLDKTHSNRVIASSKAYDDAIAGVVSARPGIVLGEASPSKVKVATTGRVRVHADATGAPIQIGDLLVTADEAGYAMKSKPVDIGGIKIHRPGTILGKALEPLAGGKGEILVLLSLQ